uniref:Uncharacterized protein n=1 Tax=Anguilla anguilla TaxID=7936 RepID=A0A0E9PWR5_ANGAN
MVYVLCKVLVTTPGCISASCPMRAGIHSGTPCDPDQEWVC